MKVPIHQRGFSLIEVMVAILILGVAVAGLAGAVHTALASSKDSELETTSALLAAGRIEILRAGGGYQDGDSDGDFGEALPLYKWKQSLSATATDGLHEVVVTINDSRNGSVLYELRTLLFEPSGINYTNGPASRRTDSSANRKKTPS